MNRPVDTKQGKPVLLKPMPPPAVDLKHKAEALSLTTGVSSNGSSFDKDSVDLTGKKPPSLQEALLSQQGLIASSQDDLDATIIKLKGELFNIPFFGKLAIAGRQKGVLELKANDVKEQLDLLAEARGEKLLTPKSLSAHITHGLIKLPKAHRPKNIQDLRRKIESAKKGIDLLNKVSKEGSNVEPTKENIRLLFDGIWAAGARKGHGYSSGMTFLHSAPVQEFILTYAKNNNPTLETDIDRMENPSEGFFSGIWDKFLSLKRFLPLSSRPSLRNSSHNLLGDRVYEIGLNFKTASIINKKHHMISVTKMRINADGSETNGPMGWKNEDHGTHLAQLPAHLADFFTKRPQNKVFRRQEKFNKEQAIKALSLMGSNEPSVKEISEYKKLGRTGVMADLGGLDSAPGHAFETYMKDTYNAPPFVKGAYAAEVRLSAADLGESP